MPPAASSAGIARSEPRGESIQRTYCRTCCGASPPSPSSAPSGLPSWRRWPCSPHARRATTHPPPCSMRRPAARSWTAAPGPRAALGPDPDRPARARPPSRSRPTSARCRPPAALPWKPPCTSIRPRHRRCGRARDRESADGGGQRHRHGDLVLLLEWVSGRGRGGPARRPGRPVRPAAGVAHRDGLRRPLRRAAGGRLLRLPVGHRRPEGRRPVT